MISITLILIIGAAAVATLGVIILWARKSGAQKVINKSLRKSRKISNEIKKTHDKVDAATVDADVKWLQRHSSRKS